MRHRPLDIFKSQNRIRLSGRIPIYISKLKRRLSLLRMFHFKPAAFFSAIMSTATMNYADIFDNAVFYKNMADCGL